MELRYAVLVVICVAVAGDGSVDGAAECPCLAPDSPLLSVTLLANGYGQGCKVRV